MGQGQMIEAGVGKLCGRALSGADLEAIRRAILEAYLIQSNQGVLGALGFGAAAWKVAARDRWIGWERPAREAHPVRVLNNARFLILPCCQTACLSLLSMVRSPSIQPSCG